jgi:heat shock protein HslJ
MRSTRRLVSLVLLGMLAVSGTPTLAQDEPNLPRALSPDGQLPLEGTAWRLRSYVYRDIQRAVGPEVAAWLRLNGGSVSGSGGCTTLRGDYAATGAALKIDMGKVRRPSSCGEQTAIVQIAMVDALKRSASHQMIASDEPRGTELVFRDGAEVEVLRFNVDDVASLTGDEWRLMAYTIEGQRSEADHVQPAVLSFQSERGNFEARRRSDGQIVGSTGCNGIVGDYFRHADVISFSPLERTDAPCIDQAAVQEQAIISVIDATSSALSLPPDRLVITSADSGDALEFVSASTLEGSTWLLSSLAKGKKPDDTVTLRLEDGTARGEGPCGPYSGSYTTDGLFITFTELTGAGDMDCAERAQERVLLNAMRRAVRLDRTDGDLTLLDASGARTARFTSPGTL